MCWRVRNDLEQWSFSQQQQHRYRQLRHHQRRRCFQLPNHQIICEQKFHIFLRSEFFNIWLLLLCFFLDFFAIHTSSKIVDVLWETEWSTEWMKHLRTEWLILVVRKRNEIIVLSVQLTVQFGLHKYSTNLTGDSRSCLLASVLTAL